jgi:hypothetical protein
MGSHNQRPTILSMESATTSFVNRQATVLSKKKIPWKKMQHHTGKRLVFQWQSNIFLWAHHNPIGITVARGEIGGTHLHNNLVNN